MPPRRRTGWRTPPGRPGPAAHRKTRLARHSPASCTSRCGSALADGVLLVDQAEVIIAAVDALPGDLVDDDLRREAQATLIEYAAKYDAKDLRRSRETDPRSGRPRGRRGPRGQTPGEGRARRRGGRGVPDDRGRARQVARQVHPAGPARRDAPQGPAGDRRPQTPAPTSTGRRPSPGARPRTGWVQAFMEYIERYPTDQLPHAGGVSATVVVTMGMDTLLGGLKAAQLDTGHRISPGLARRLACQAGIIPAVLGGQSQVLDLGRKTRFHTEAQRIALAIEQGGCTAEGCDWPPGMCHAHHDQPWSQRRRHRPEERPAALPPPPRQSPRPHLRDDQAPRRQGQVPPENVSRSRPHQLG